MEASLFWLTVFLYVMAFVLQLSGFVTGWQTGGRVARWAVLAGLAVHTALLGARWAAGGHAPVTNTYELNLTGAWITVLAFLIFAQFRKVDPFVGLVVVPGAFLLLGHGYLSRTPAAPMGPDYRSPWLGVHVIFAFLAFGSFLMGTAAALLLLLRGRIRAWRPGAAIPEAEALDLASYRLVAFGFINHAIMLASGSIWAKQLWGRYWSWDALETWSLIAFLFYAFYLHTRSFLGWKLRRAAWLTVAGLVVLVVSFWGVEWFAPSVHPGP